MTVGTIPPGRAADAGKRARSTEPSGHLLWQSHRPHRTLLLLFFGHTLRVDALAGALTGGAPFFEQFFVGDLHPYIPARSLGLNFSRRRGPQLTDGRLDTQRYERLAGRLGGEYRIPLGKSGSAYGTEFFVGGALLTLSSPGDEPVDAGPWPPFDAVIDFGSDSRPRRGDGSERRQYFPAGGSVITAVLLVLLAGPSPLPWLERDGNQVRVSFDLTGVFDALKRRIKRLSTTLRVHASLEAVDTQQTIGSTWRVARVRWDCGTKS